MVLLTLHQRCCITQAVALLEHCHVPQQLPVSDENGVRYLITSEGVEGNNVGGIGGCAQTPLVLKGLIGVGGLEACEVEGDLAGVGPESWHSHPECSNSTVQWCCNVEFVSHATLNMHFACTSCNKNPRWRLPEYLQAARHNSMTLMLELQPVWGVSCTTTVLIKTLFHESCLQCTLYSKCKLYSVNIWLGIQS